MNAWRGTMAVCSVWTLAAVASIAVPALAPAAEFGDANRGRDFAEQMYVECHVVRAQSTAFPGLDTPTFEAVADMPSTTRLALTVWFRTSRPYVPNLVLDAEDVDHVIAYNLSLKDGR